MRSIIQVSVPSTELVTSADMSPMLHGYPAGEASFLALTITAARDYVEGMTGYCLAPRNFIQYSDRFPMQSLFSPMFPIPFPLLGFVPSINSTVQRSPYEIELMRNPVLAVSQIVYLDTTWTPQTLLPGVDFAADLTSTPARVTPMPQTLGSSALKFFWPACLPGPKSVAIYYTAGYYTTADQLTTEAQPRDLGFPPILKALVMALTEKWFVNRDNYGEVPKPIQDLIFANRVTDYNPSIE